MKNKLLIVLSVAAALFITVSTVYAFTMGSIDVTWGLIDTDGADRDTWATGPAAGSTDFDSPNYLDGDPGDHETVQNLIPFDWNQVRYGEPAGTVSGFGGQSGFGFLGRSTVGDSPAENVPFYVGQFCHFNNPIYSNDTSLDYVPLDIEVANLGCTAPYELVSPTSMAFTYVFNLDETGNNPTTCTFWDYGNGDCLCMYGSGWDATYRNRCPYGPGSLNWPADGGTYCTGTGDPYGAEGPGTVGDLNYAGCADEVTITKSVTSAEFECVDDLDNLDPLDNVSKKYTVSLLGFIEKTTPGAACPTDPTNIQNNLVYTAEGQDNCYCVYAAVTSEDITPVILKDLKAESTAGGILVSWQTTTEINNLRFNLYRAKSLYGSRVQLNDQPINGELANPGNPFGGHYEYLDKTGDVGMTYYYWLEDIPADSSYVPELFGPVSAVR